MQGWLPVAERERGGLIIQTAAPARAGGHPSPPLTTLLAPRAQDSNPFRTGGGVGEVERAAPRRAPLRPPPVAVDVAPSAATGGECAAVAGVPPPPPPRQRAALRPADPRHGKEGAPSAVIVGLSRVSYAARPRAAGVDRGETSAPPTTPTRGAPAASCGGRPRRQPFLQGRWWTWERGGERRGPGGGWSRQSSLGGPNVAAGAQAGIVAKAAVPAAGRRPPHPWEAHSTRTPVCRHTGGARSGRRAGPATQSRDLSLSALSRWRARFSPHPVLDRRRRLRRRRHAAEGAAASQRPTGGSQSARQRQQLQQGTKENEGWLGRVWAGGCGGGGGGRPAAIVRQATRCGINQC